MPDKSVYDVMFSRTNIIILMCGVPMIVLFHWPRLSELFDSIPGKFRWANEDLEVAGAMVENGLDMDAMFVYDAAIMSDPTNYEAYHKRAMLYEKKKIFTEAIIDFNKAIELKPDYGPSRRQRAQIKIRHCRLKEALDDYNIALPWFPHDETIRSAIEDVKLALEKVHKNVDKAKNYYNTGDYRRAIVHLTNVLKDCPWHISGREMRANCYLALGDVDKGMDELHYITTIEKDRVDILYRMANIYYENGNVSETKKKLRTCLKLYPDHPQCSPFHKKVKKLLRAQDTISDLLSSGNQKDYIDCVQQANIILQLEPEMMLYRKKAIGRKCHCYSKAKLLDEANKACGEMLLIDKRNVEALCDRASARLQAEIYTEAFQDISKANFIKASDAHVKNLLQSARNQLKQSTKGQDSMKMILNQADLKMKKCKLNDAKKDFKLLKFMDPNDSDLNRQIDKINSLEKEIPENLEEAAKIMTNRDMKGAIDIYTATIQYCPLDPTLRQLRADCYMELKDYPFAISDLEFVAKTSADKPAAQLYLSNVLYEIGYVDQSYRHVIECLRLNQEHEGCKIHYKYIKQLTKYLTNIKVSLEQQDYKTCLKEADNILQLDEIEAIYQQKAEEDICHCSSKVADLTLAVSSCSVVLEKNPYNDEALCDRGEAYLYSSMFDDALKDFRGAYTINPASRRARQGIKMAQSKTTLKSGAAKPNVQKQKKKDTALEGNHEPDDNTSYTNSKTDSGPSDSRSKAEVDKENTREQETYFSEALALVKNGNHKEASQIFTRLIKNEPEVKKYRKLRGLSYIEIGNDKGAIEDFRMVTEVESDDAEIYYLLSKLLFKSGEVQPALHSIQRCLVLDPDNRKFAALHRGIAKVEEVLSRVDELVKSQSYYECIAVIEENIPLIQSIPGGNLLSLNRRYCHCSAWSGLWEKAVEICSGVIAQNPHDVVPLCDRAEAYTTDEQFDEALDDLKKAEKLDNKAECVKLGFTVFRQMLSQYKSDFGGEKHKLFLGKAKRSIKSNKPLLSIKYLETALHHHPNYDQAIILKSKVKLKQGYFKEARNLLEQLELSEDPHILDESREIITRVEHNQFHLASILQLATESENVQDTEGEIAHLSKAIQLVPWDAVLRQRRADCYKRSGYHQHALEDLMYMKSLVQDTRPIILEYSQLLYSMGKAEQSLIEIRECLKMDEDYKHCQAHYSKVKKLLKHIKKVETAIQTNNYEECVNRTENILRSAEDIEQYTDIAEMFKCRCLAKIQVQDAIPVCYDVLKKSTNNKEILQTIGEIHLSNDEFDKAITLYQTALENHPDDEELYEMLEKIQDHKSMNTSKHINHDEL